MATPQEEFEPKLGKALIAADLITRDELAEALEQQVLTGGHLATNLWELGLCTIADLTRHSAAILEMKHVPPKTVAQTPTKILHVLPRNFVAQHRVIPLRARGRELLVATSEPWNIEALDDTARRAQRKIKPYFLAEVPLVKLLEKLYKIPSSARFKLTPQKRVRAGDAPEVSQDSIGEDLISDEEFASIYGAGDAAAADATEDFTAPAIEDHNEHATSDVPEEEIIELAEIVEEPEPLPQLQLEPITDAAQATELLAEATNRDELGTLLVRLALSRGKRAVLLTLQRDLWMGWTGAGEGITPENVRALMLPSEQGTCFGLVNMTKAHFLGPLAPHPVHQRFLELLGGHKPQSAGLFPVHFHGRVVFGVYMDGGDGGYISPDIADILIFAQRVPMAIERLVKQKQMA